MKLQNAILWKFCQWEKPHDRITVLGWRAKLLFFFQRGNDSGNGHLSSLYVLFHLNTLLKKIWKAQDLGFQTIVEDFSWICVLSSTTIWDVWKWESESMSRKTTVYNIWCNQSKDKFSLRSLSDQNTESTISHSSSPGGFFFAKLKFSRQLFQ